MIQNGYSMCCNEWALDKSIRNELGLLLIISSLTAKTGSCFAKNEYFSSLFDIDITNVSKKIKLLEQKGYIKIDYVKEGSKVKSRQIRLAKLPIDRWQNYQSTVGENTKENNISINNTSNNIKEIYKEKFEEFWKEYPKQRIGSKQRAYTSFCRVLKENRITFEKLMQAVKDYKDSDEVARGFAKGCAAWLNDDRFNVEYTKDDDWVF